MINTEALFLKCFPRRKADSHKGDYGRLLLIAGSKGMTGAAVLAARAALRSGCGLVYALVPESIYPVLQTSVTEIILRDRGEEQDLSRYDGIVIGPGMGINRENADLLRSALRGYGGPVLLDADALTMIAGYGLFSELKARSERSLTTCITPHMGEAAVLLGADPRELTKDMPYREGRMALSEALGEKTGAAVLLKGHETLVYDPETGEHYINFTGNPGMATAGSGDVLSGIAGALLAMGHRGFEALSAGAYIHGLAGDLGAEAGCQESLIASDIVDNIAKAIDCARK